MRTRIWGYEGIFPGPTIEARRGRAAVVTHTNCLGVPTVTHLHGGDDAPAIGWLPYRYRRSWRNTHLPVPTMLDGRRRSGITITAGVGPEEISTWVSPVFTC